MTSQLVPNPNALPPAHNVKQSRDRMVPRMFYMPQKTLDRLTKLSKQMKVSSAEIVRLALQAVFDGRIGTLESINRKAK
jgi:hypothetical protein